MEKLCQRDLTSILINIMYVKLLLAIPRNILVIAGNASWILSFIATLVILVLFHIITSSGSFQTPLTEIKNRTVQIIIGIMSTAFLLLSVSSVAKIYPETVKIILLQDTPIELIFLITGVVTVLGAYIGIKPIGRIVSLFQPIALTVMVFCFILLLPHMHISNITPVFNKGIVSPRALTSISAFADIFLLFILPNDKVNIRKTGFRAIITMGIIMTLTLLVYCLIYPHSISANFVLPFYQMVRLIQVGDFFGRFEAFFEFIWSISIMAYFSVYLYALSILWQKIFKLQYHKPLLAPFMIIISLLVYNSPAYTELNRNYVWYSICLIGGSFIIPLSAGIFKKYEERKSKK